jgi:hypothetical protein
MFKKKEKVVTPPAEEVMSRGEWMQKYWRPCAAFMYMTCCLADFAIFPIMFTVVQFWETQAANDAFRQWVPITLQGGGLFHVSMCAVLGVSAYGRTQEKLAGQSAVPDAAGLPSPTLSSAPPAQPSFGGTPSGFNNTAAPSVSAPATGFGSSASFATPAPAAADASSGFGATLATTAGGKKIVPEFGQPLL